MYQIADTTHLLETTIELWMGIEKIEIVEEVRKEIRQPEVDTKLKEETPGLTLV